MTEQQDQQQQDQGGANNDPQDQDQQQQDQDQQQQDQDQGDDDSGDLRQTFDRDYVERLRSKSAGYRLRMKDAEKRAAQLERALHAERVARLDMVVDPAQVPFDPDHLEDEAQLVADIEQLLESKPYLRKRKVGGDIGQHDKQSHGDGFSLLGALRANAG